MITTKLIVSLYTTFVEKRVAWLSGVGRRGTYSQSIVVDMISIRSILNQHLGDLHSLTNEERCVLVRVLDVDVGTLLQQVIDQVLVSVGCCGVPADFSNVVVKKKQKKKKRA